MTSQIDLKLCIFIVASMVVQDSVQWAVVFGISNPILPFLVALWILVKHDDVDQPMQGAA